MGFLKKAFRKVGKFVGGIATLVVPGFDRLAATGIMGSDLAAFAGGPQQTAVERVIASSPAMMENVMAPPAPPTGPYIPSTTADVLARAARSPPLSGRTVTMPTEYASALVRASRGGAVVQPNVPGAVSTPLSAVRAQLPTGGIPPNILGASVFNW